MAARHADRSRPRRRAHARHLPQRAIPPRPRPPRRQPRLTRRRALAARRRLAHAPTGETYHDPAATTTPPRPPTHHPTPRRPARTARTHRHPPRESCCLTKRDFLFRDEHRAPTRELLGACFSGARERQTTDGFPVAYAEACDLLRRISGDLIRISDLPAPSRRVMIFADASGTFATDPNASPDDSGSVGQP
jgi:hypothetical protein